MQSRLDPGLVKKELLEALCGQLAKFEGLLWWFSGKEFACHAGDSGDTGSIPGLGTSPGGGSSSPLQYFCLENSMDRGAWWATVHEITKSLTLLSKIWVWTTDSGQFSVISVKSECGLQIPVSSVQSFNRVLLLAPPWPAARQASLSITNSRSLLKLMTIESVMPSNHLILCRPLLLLPSIFSSIRVFSNESVLCIKWPKYWSFTAD